MGLVNGRAGLRRCYLSSTVTSEPLEMLSDVSDGWEDDRSGRRDSNNKSGSSTVVVHEERLQTDQERAHT